MRRIKFNRTCFLVLVALLSSFLSLQDVKGYVATIPIKLKNGETQNISYGTYISSGDFFDSKDGKYICTPHNPPSSCRTDCYTFWTDSSGNRSCSSISAYCSNPMYSGNDICLRLAEEQGSYVELNSGPKEGYLGVPFFKRKDENGRYVELFSFTNLGGYYGVGLSRLRNVRKITKDSIFYEYDLAYLKSYDRYNSRYSIIDITNTHDYYSGGYNPEEHTNRCESMSGSTGEYKCYTYEQVCKNPPAYLNDRSSSAKKPILNTLVAICNWFLEDSSIIDEGNNNYNSNYNNEGNTSYVGNAFNGELCVGTAFNPSSIYSSVSDSVGNISFSLNAKSVYGPIQPVATYPGGPYTTRFTFSAAYSLTYISNYRCKAIEYKYGNKNNNNNAGNNGDNGQESFWTECGTSPSSFSGVAPTIGDSWKKHPNEVILTEDIDGADKVKMKFVEDSDCDAPSVISSGGIYNTGSLPSDIGEINRGNMSAGLIQQMENEGAIYGAKGGEKGFYSALDTNNDGVIDENEKYTAYHSRTVTRRGKISEIRATGSYCSSSGTEPVASDYVNAMVSAYSAKLAEEHKEENGTICSIVTSSGSGCDIDDEGNYRGTTQKYTVSCDLNWIGDYIVYSIPEYQTVSDKYCGHYEIEDKFNINDRFEATDNKYIPISTLTGNYYYKIYGGDGFGDRKCNLYVKAPICTGPNCDDTCVGASCIPVTPCEGDYCGKHWSDFLYFRNVEVASLFPNRQPGRNWVGYDTSIVPSKQTDVMYHIELSSSTMKKIAKDTNIDNYVGWKLNSSYKPSYLNSSNIYEYDWSHDHGYSSLGDLRNLGATIIENREIIEKRNKELIKSDYNKYNTGK